MSKFNNNDVDWCNLALNLSAHLAVEEPGDAVTSFSGRILTLEKDDSEGEAGTISGYLVPIVNDEGQDPFEMLDYISEDTAAYIDLLRADGEWIPEVEEVIGDDIGGCSLLILDRIDIHAPYRGRRLGLLAVRRLIKIFEEQTAIAAMKPFPLQFTHYLADDWVAPPGVTDKHRAFAEALAKLQAYWAQLGFAPVSGTDLWVLNPAAGLPTYKSVKAGRPQCRQRGGRRQARMGAN